MSCTSRSTAGYCWAERQTTATALLGSAKQAVMCSTVLCCALLSWQLHDMNGPCRSLLDTASNEWQMLQHCRPLQDSAGQCWAELATACHSVLVTAGHCFK
jgi:hypothetical protein